VHLLKPREVQIEELLPFTQDVGVLMGSLQ